MGEITVSNGKFLRLFDYLQRVGLDAEAIGARVQLSPRQLARLDRDRGLPARHYSRLYREAVLAMQTLQQGVPWGAGLGSETFELMCHCLIGARTLEEALRLATRYDALLYPQTGYRISLSGTPDAAKARLDYVVDIREAGSVLIPEDWDRAANTPTVLRASGLLVWHALCGWLTGRPLDSLELCLAAPSIGRGYHDRLESVFQCPVRYDASDNSFSFPAEDLERRIVQTPGSLEEFLHNSVYHLIATEAAHTTTTAAIKSLVKIDLPRGMPSFSDIAGMLYMSESSLRRRLQREGTSYQAIKDEVRCEVAVDKLVNEEATVADLAELLGFTEPSSFVRSFKSWTGRTPRAYKEQFRSLGTEAGDSRA